MVKFSAKDDAGYERLLGELRRWIGQERGQDTLQDIF